MIKIADVIEQLVSQDGFVLEAMQKGLLNNSAYAKQIHSLVEERTMKSVKLGTIVVSLSRIANTIHNRPPFTPRVEITGLTITSFLSEVTYERSESNLKKLSALSTSWISSKEFFTVTQGSHEITIVCSENARDSVIKHFGIAPKVIMNDLVAISVRFPVDYMDVPNTIFSLVGALATRHINLMEIVSTYTELTFVVFKDEMENTIQALNVYSRSITK